MPARAFGIAGAAIAALLLFGHKPQGLSYAAADLWRLNAAQDTIIRWAIAHNVQVPVVSIDWLSDSLGPEMLAVAAYERFDKLIEFQHGMAGSLFAIPREAAMADLERSDIVILSEIGNAAHPFADPTIPFYDSVRALEPEMWSWTVANREPLDRFTLSGIGMTIFVRR